MQTGAVLTEALLFVQAGTVLVEVLGRIRPEHAGVVLPAMHPGADRPEPLADAVSRQVRADVRLARLLGAPAADGDAARGPAAAAAASTAAARRDDGDTVVRTDEGDLTVRDLLLRAALARCLLAHYAAAHLGSTACPLPEELARPLWELTAPDAETWRRLGWFRAPRPLPDHVSWRDRLLLCAGHSPHPSPSGAEPALT